MADSVVYSVQASTAGLPLVEQGLSSCGARA